MRCSDWSSDGCSSDLPERHDGLEGAVARLLGGITSGITFHQKQLTGANISAGTVGQFTRQRRALSDLFTHDLFGSTQTFLRMVDGQLGQGISTVGVLFDRKSVVCGKSG